MDMEQRVREIEIAQARMEVVVQQMGLVLADNTKAIRELTGVLNKGKGAMWVMAGAYTLLGGVVAAIIAWIKG